MLESQSILKKLISIKIVHSVLFTAQLFKESDYDTFFVAKWHISIKFCFTFDFLNFKINLVDISLSCVHCNCLIKELLK